MRHLLARLGSTRVTLSGFALLAAAVFAVETWPGAPESITVVPLVVLAANLLCALATRRRLRAGGLGVFHVALLALMIVAAGGRLTRFEGRVEVAEGGELEAAAVEATFRGPLHDFRLAEAAFAQGPLRVEYRTGLRRAHTTTVVRVQDDDGRTRTVPIGDDVPLVVDGYRFYTTHNKGFAPVVTWTPHGGAAQSGALHLPSYPRFDGAQELRWQPPGGSELRMFLRLDQPLDETRDWVLEPGATPAALIVHGGGRRAELRPGESLALAEGTLHYERLAGWMGYRIYYDPTLPALAAIALVAILGLAWHLWRVPTAARLVRGVALANEEA
jgi:cytochrome c biogenesis protein